MRNQRRGFTIVELAFAIAIIAVLASVAFVAYRGVKERAQNAQTTNAAQQWFKALQSYKFRTSGLPTVSSCLGTGYKYNADESATSGIGQCRQINSTTGITINSTFYSAMTNYVNNNPTPAMVTAANSTTDWYRGLLYLYDSTNSLGKIVFALDKSAGSCPALGSVSPASSINTTDGDYVCTYTVGKISGY